MAASDPTIDVATPTGVLQGVAAFSWDGSAWQPSGRAGPSVATPTGVLQGVAAFNGGPAWQPAGRAQPGVATPSGVLDGVAVYTWSGSAWTPPGGTATPSTPSGALRGIAAFSWDGAAWQPAAQARPSVATPTGVLDGVAMFNWGGSTWQAGAAVPAGATLDLSFMSGTLNPLLTFTRGSVATYFDNSGVMQTVSGNTPRLDYDPVTHAALGLLVEDTRTNVLLNTATLGTQSVTVTGQAYTLSFYGTGTITKSGTAAGALVGTGAFPARVSQTFTPTAGTLTLTVTGSVLNAQLEAGAFVSSWIPTTGVAVTRSLEQCSMPTAAWFSATAMSVVSETSVSGVGSSGFSSPITLHDGTVNNRLQHLVSSGNAVASLVASSGVNSVAIPDASVITLGTPFKFGSSLIAGTYMSSFNGGALYTNTTAIVMPLGVNTLSIGGAYATYPQNGYIRRIRYWPRALSSAELQSVTT